MHAIPVCDHLVLNAGNEVALFALELVVSDVDAHHVRFQILFQRCLEVAQAALDIHDPVAVMPVARWS